MILLLAIRFLDDLYHGLTDNGEAREWPPSPFRVFQALLAGNARGTDISNVVEDALRWLEKLGPPVIIAPRAQGGQTLLTYVLNNVDDRSRTPKTLRPTLFPGDRLVQYAWTFDKSEANSINHANAVAAAARHIRAVGWGIDMAIGHATIVEHLPAPVKNRAQYNPSKVLTLGGATLRSPMPGSIDSLKRLYADSLQRYKSPGITELEPANAMYDTFQYVQGSVRPSVAFRLVNDDGDTAPIRQQLIAPLVGMIRALGRRPDVVQNLGHQVIDRDFLGHPKESSPDRVSIVPLPTVRDGPTDGQIRRLMFIQPATSDGRLCRLLAELFDGQVLKPDSGETRFPELRLERLVRYDNVLPAYVCTSNIWASVTPVLLPGYDDRKQHRGIHSKRLERAAGLVRKALTQSSFPDATGIELSRVPFFSGALHTRDYFPREKQQHYPRFHVLLRFDRPLTGPIAIGAGRHTGFGVFAHI